MARLPSIGPARGGAALRFPRDLLLLAALAPLAASCRPGAPEDTEHVATARAAPSGASRARAPRPADRGIARRDLGNFGLSGVRGADRPAPGARDPSGGGASPERVIECPRAAALAPGECAASGAGSALVVRGVVIAADAVLAGGEVRIGADGRVECVACDCPGEAARRLECDGAVVSPGFVNLHDHITYAGTPPIAESGARYEHRHEWRLGLDGHEKLAYSGRASDAEVLAHELRMVMSGVTSILGAGGERGLARNLELDASSELGPLGVALSTFPLADSAGPPAGAECGFSARRDGADTVARTRAYVPHLGEGIDALARSEIACSAAGRHDLFAPGTAVIHAVGVTASEAALLADSGASVVWSPRSNVSLYGNTAPIPLLRRLGVPVALGTDWLASGSMNLLRELACAEHLSATRFDGALSPYDLFSMVTFEAALAIRAEDQLGSLAPGRAGDLAVFAAADSGDPFAAIVRAAPPAVRLVVRGGRVLYGDAELVAALAPDDTCEELDACGAAKRACVAADTGHALAEIRAAGQAIHPLAYCGPDVPEPSCEPFRPGEYGAPSENDGDGDGVDDAADLCPRVFDPVRPLDAAGQADTDADGRGDACDACPLTPGETCFERAALDRDRDGVPDSADACPRDAELAHADQDGDGRGDACDFCPAPNPGAAPCALSIRALRDPEHAARPPLGSAVAIEAWVSAVRPDGRGFFLQDAAAAYSGVEVYAGSGALDVALGDRVQVVGVTNRFADRDELLLVAVTRLDPSGEPPPPLDVDAASVGDAGTRASELDGVLVRVSSVVVETNPDLPNDYDETLLDAGLRVDDRLLPDLDNAFPPGTPFDVTGVLGFSFGHWKLWPRTPADIPAR